MADLLAVLTPERRAYLYRVLTAVGALVLVYGIATADQVSAWLMLAANVLGTGLAAINTPTPAKRNASPPEE